MKCPQCQVENKDQAKSCRKCGMELQLPTLWQPTWEWHGKTLGIIYVVLIVLYLVMKSLLKPYIRHLSPEVTPWLHPRSVSNAQKP